MSTMNDQELKKIIEQIENDEPDYEEEDDWMWTLWW